MINKVQQKGKCPFRNMKPCSDECVLYRKGVRFNEGRNESYVFEECALNLIADNLEAMHNRTYALQKEVGETKNVIAFKILSEFGKVDQETALKKAQKIINIPDDHKLLK